jgi:signal transduction histidine kinase
VLVMKARPSIEDLVGLGHTKLGFFKEVQVKMGELKKSNSELDRERRHVQAILDGITDIVAVVSPEHRIRSVNHSFFDVYPGADPIGRPCHEVFRGREAPCESCVMREAVHANRVVRQSAIISVSGRNRHFEITASPLRSAAGLPTDILVVKRDVTLEKEYQAKYYHAEKMATIGLLAAGVAHEINNPLTAVRGFAEGLQRRMAAVKSGSGTPRLQEDVDEYLAIILKECRRCSDIVQSLLTFSPRKELDFSRVDINQLVRNVLRILHHRLKHHPEDFLTLDLEPDLAMVRGLPAELEQVILNLILNAMDAVCERGSIQVRTGSSLESGQVWLEVRDNGCGIGSEHMPKLFEPFFTTKPVGKGIGIGLSTCYSIIRTHGGEIGVESAPGSGSRFTVRLPGAFEREEPC